MNTAYDMWKTSAPDEPSTPSEMDYSDALDIIKDDIDSESYCDYLTGAGMHDNHPVRLLLRHILTKPYPSKSSTQYELDQLIDLFSEVTETFEQEAKSNDEYSIIAHEIMEIRTRMAKEDGELSHD